MTQSYEQVIIVGPTRPICVNIYRTIQARGLPERTYLSDQKGTEIQDALNNLEEVGFGVVAGTGTGKTVLIKRIAVRALGRDSLRYAIITREHEATREALAADVIVMTPQIAMRKYSNHELKQNILPVLDEVHQTSGGLEAAMMFARDQRSRIVWLSGTVEHEIYSTYLRAGKVIICKEIDPTKRGVVQCHRLAPEEFIDANIDSFKKRQRGIAVFVPTRARAEELAHRYNQPGIKSDYYHGGETADKLVPYLTGRIPRPYILFMTAAGSSSLNVTGLNNVIIEDTKYDEVVLPGGILSLEEQPLGNNDILQMAGRVVGRASDGEVDILTSRTIDFWSLQPTAPTFMLGGSLSMLVMQCAAYGKDVRAMQTIGEYDLLAYQRLLDHYVQCGLVVIGPKNGELHLTQLGKQVNRLGASVPWGRMIIAAKDTTPTLLRIAVVLGSIEGLFRVRREQAYNRTEEVVTGSDHLTTYNIIAAAIRLFATLENGKRYHIADVKAFRDWCRRGLYVHRDIQEALLGIQALYRQLGIPLPAPEEFVRASEAQEGFYELLVETAALDLIQDGRHSSSNGELQPGLHSFAPTSGYVLGTVQHRGRYTNYEGTWVPRDLVKKHSTYTIARILSVPRDGWVKVVKGGLYAAEALNDSVEDEVPSSEIPEFLRADLAKALGHWLAAQKTTGNKQIDTILEENKRQVERERHLNDLFPSIVAIHDLDRFYAEVCMEEKARCLHDIRFECLRLPALDESQLQKSLGDFVESIIVFGQRVLVDYRQGADKPRAVLPDLAIEGRWRLLDDTVFTLSNGTPLSLEGPYSAEPHSSGIYAKDGSLKTLRLGVRKHLLDRMWYMWRKEHDFPADDWDIPLRVAETTELPEMRIVSYGVDPLDGSEAKRYGTWAPRTPYTKEAFEGEWFISLAEAEDARVQVQEEILQAKEQLRRNAEYAARELRVKQVLGEINRLCQSGFGLSKYFGQHLRIRPYTDNQAWLDEAEPLIARVALYEKAEALLDYGDRLTRNKVGQFLADTSGDAFDALVELVDAPPGETVTDEWLERAWEIVEEAEKPLELERRARLSSYLFSEHRVQYPRRPA